MNNLSWGYMKYTVDYIRTYTDNFIPEIGIVLGSGLGDFAENNQEYVIPYEQIPRFQYHTNIDGHKGKLVFANIAGRKVVIMQGRIHYYEGYSMEQVTYPIKVMRALGVSTLILTNAAGIVNKSFRPGDLMVITDHINFMGVNPLIDKENVKFGVRFPDMSEAYNKNLIKIVDAAGRLLNINLRHGVYMATSGPSYETPAEIKMARAIGADAIGMSTVPEAIVANSCDMKVIGLSCLTNYASGVSDKKLNHGEVLKMANDVKDKFSALLMLILQNIK